jgi:hypothetical protein
MISAAQHAFGQLEFFLCHARPRRGRRSVIFGLARQLLQVALQHAGLASLEHTAGSSW